MRLDGAARADPDRRFHRYHSTRSLIRARDQEPVVIYHSHTATEAYPSRTDASLAQEPGAHYVLVSTRDPERAEFRSFRILEGQVNEEPVQVVQSYLFGHTPTSMVYDCP